MNGQATSRIVVALDPAGGGDFALEIAALIAAGTLEVVGLFVEDARLLEHARSPLAREVAFSGRERSLDRPTLERQLRAQAAQARNRFEAAAVKLGLRPTFQITRGEVLTELAREAAEAELLVVSVGAETRRRGGWGAPLEQLVRARLPTLLFARESPPGGVLVVLEKTDCALAALTTAARLSRPSGAPLMLLATAAVLADGDVNAALRNMGAGASVVAAVESITAATIVHAARGAQLVIVPSRDMVSDETLIGDLLAKLHAPLMLMRGRTRA
jgi:hypothetical protein